MKRRHIKKKEIGLIMKVVDDYYKFNFDMLYFFVNLC